MKIFLLSLISFFLLTNTTTAQDLSINWQNNIGGTDLDVCYEVKRTPDGGYVLGCYSDSAISEDKSENSFGGSLDFWVVKLNADGEIQWDNTIGGSDFDVLFGIAVLDDGSMVVAGESKSSIGGDKTVASQGGSDYWVLKLDTEGNILWQNAFGGSSDDILRGFNTTADGGFLLTGHSFSGISGDKTEANNGLEDYWVVKIDSNGVFQWDKTLGGSGIDHSWSVSEATDGSIFVGGLSNSPISGDKTEPTMGSRDLWIAKLSSGGDLIWENTIGGDGSDVVYDMVATEDNGLVLGAMSNSNISGDKTENSKGGSDIWMVKLNEDGNILWQKTIGGSSSDGTDGLIRIPDVGYLIASNSTSPVSGDKTEGTFSYDYWIVKVDETGNVIDQNTIQGFDIDIALGLDLAHESGYIAVGYSDSDTGLDKEEDAQGYFDIWVTRLDLPLNTTEFEDNTSLLTYPNPASEMLTITTTSGTPINTLSLYNSLGQKVYELDNLNGSQFQLDLNGFSSGLYVLNVETDNEIFSRRILID